MSRAPRLLLTLTLLAASPAPAGLKVESPRQGGLVLGTAVPVHVTGVRTPPSCTLDGAPVQPAWVRLPRDQHWYAELQVTPGRHTLRLKRGLRRAELEFEAGLTSSVALGERVAARFLAEHAPDTVAWQWGPAVYLYGLARFAERSPQRAAYTRYLQAYHAHHAAQGLPTIDYPDVCPPALSAIWLAREAGDPSALPNADRVADFLRNEPRNPLGALEHLGQDSRMRRLARRARVLRFVGLGWISDWVHSIWVDSLVMYALTAVHYGKATGDTNLVEFGLAQPGIFARVLQDPRTGLFGHAWDWQRQRRQGGVWLRGNGWVATSIVDMLEEIPASHPRHAELLAILRPLAQGLLATQDAAGQWPTLLDGPETYQEASGTALAAYALARGAHRGWLPPAALDAAKQAFRGLSARLLRRPVGHSLTGTSIATSAWPRWLYPRIPKRADVDYGVGAYLLLAGELQGEGW
ncbi:MAG: glycoside hydrolase family 88 protein [Planctomycetes bacterium]|nr:glycoside hydrolase family 88 protein [Planctomycetota bacterium]